MVFKSRQDHMFKIPPELYNELDRIAKQNGMGVEELIQRGIRWAILEGEAKQNRNGTSVGLQTNDGFFTLK